MDKKYEFTGETKEIIDGDKTITLRRIRALKDLFQKSDLEEYKVKKGTLGGFIQDEDCLSQEGDCWVGGEACVYGGAKVRDNARILGRARVHSKSEVRDNALVVDYAEITGGSLVCDSASIWYNALVADNSKIGGRTSLYENATVTSSKVEGISEITNSEISQSTISNSFIGRGTKIRNSLLSGHVKINIAGSKNSTTLIEDSTLSGGDIEVGPFSDEKTTSITIKDSELRDNAQVIGNSTVENSRLFNDTYVENCKIKNSELRDESTVYDSKILRATTTGKSEITRCEILLSEPKTLHDFYFYHDKYTDKKSLAIISSQEDDVEKN